VRISGFSEKIGLPSRMAVGGGDRMNVIRRRHDHAFDSLAPRQKNDHCLIHLCRHLAHF
jgi:hypothetical protein